MATDTYLAQLAGACAWLEIKRGRAAQYGKLVREFLDHGLRTAQHILAYGESCEVTDLYELWKERANEFPGLQDRMRSALGKGPLLREEERPSGASHQARDYAFSYLVAGELLAAGVDVLSIDSIGRTGPTDCPLPDVLFQRDGTLVNVECKRPQSIRALAKRVKEARRQLADSPHVGRYGVIAIDCSTIVRPAGRILELDNLASAEAQISQLLERVAAQVIAHLTASVLGFLLFVRVPTMTRVHRSVVVQSSGEPIYHFRQDSISTWLAVGNDAAAKSQILRDVAELLSRPRNTSDGIQDIGPVAR